MHLVCRPLQNQRIIYNGRKRIHAIKFPSVLAPGGLTAMLDGPYEWRKHDCGMLADSALVTDLNNFFFDQYNKSLSLYGDPLYPLKVRLHGPFENTAAVQLVKCISLVPYVEMHTLVFMDLQHLTTVKLIPLQ